VSRHLSIVTLCSSLHILVMEKVHFITLIYMCSFGFNLQPQNQVLDTHELSKLCPPGGFHCCFSLRSTTSAILAVRRAHVSSHPSPLYLPLHLYSPSLTTRGRGRCPMRRQAKRWHPSTPGSSFSRPAPLHLPLAASSPPQFALSTEAPTPLDGAP
jgi:hypothetical protein